jgi:hypothetical protein
VSEVDVTCAATVGCQRFPAVGLLCRGHLERLYAMLVEIEREAAILSAVPSMAVRSGSGGGRPAAERSPVRLDVVAMRDRRTRRWEPDEQPRYTPPAPKSFGPWCLFCEHETCTAWRAGRRRDLHDDEYDAGSANLASILEELHNWARLVREERDLAPVEQITVMGERLLLTRHLDWIAEQPWVDEMYADLTKLRAQLKQLNGTQDEKPVGRCYLPAEDGPCDGPIWVDDAAGHAHCGRCRETWDGPQLAMLSWELEQQRAELARPKTADGRPMLTVHEIAAKLGKTVNAVRIIASRERLVSVDGHYDPQAFGLACHVA